MTKPVKIVFFLLLLAVIIFGGFATATWALTRGADLPDRRATVTADQGTVEVKANGGAAWNKITTPTEVASGDSVRTGADGKATINFFDQGVARLDADTSLTIEQAAYDPEKPRLFQSKLLLESGRVWSRLLDFLTPESLYEVHTANTVATVRGTAFSVSRIKDADEVFVSEHLVALTTEGANKQFAKKDIRAGQFAYARNVLSNMAAPPPPGYKVIGKVLPPDLIEVVKEAKNGAEKDWIANNRNKDANFDALIDKLNLAEARKMVPVNPGSKFRGVVTWAEKVRLALAFNEKEKDQLRDRFAARRLADAYILESSKIKSPQLRKEIIESLREYAPLVKERKEGRVTGRVVTYFSRHGMEPSADMLDAMHELSPDDIDAIKKALERRQQFKDELLNEIDNLIEPPKEEAPVTPIEPPKTEQPIAPTQPPKEEPPIVITEPPKTEQPIVPTQPIEPTVPVKVEAYPLRLSVTANDTSLNTGGNTPLHATIIMSDNTSQDVTANTTWTVDTDPTYGKAVGYVRGSTFYAEIAGTAPVNGTHYYNDKPYTGTATITITLPVVRPILPFLKF